MHITLLLKSKSATTAIIKNTLYTDRNPVHLIKSCCAKTAPFPVGANDAMRVYFMLHRRGGAGNTTHRNALSGYPEAATLCSYLFHITCTVPDRAPIVVQCLVFNVSPV